MGLETVTYISDLVASNPVGATDPKSQGDDHIRNIKAALLATFPSITGEVTLTHTQLNAAAIKSAANVLTSAASGSDYPLQLSSATPLMAFNETDGGSNEKIWDLGAAGEVFLLRTRTDAYGAGISALAITRGMGTAVAEIELNATLLDFNGVADFNSTVQVNDTLSIRDGNAAGPGVVFFNDPNTGLFRGGVDILGIAVGGAEVSRFSAAEIDLTATLLDFNGAVDVSGNLQLNSSGDQLTISGAIAKQWFIETGVTADNGKWDFHVNVEQFDFRVVNDAESAASSVFSVQRTGTTIDEFEINATLLDLNVTTLDFAGALTTPNTSASEVGFKGLPAATDETPVLADAGKVINLTTNATIPANASIAYPVGTVLTFYNVSGSSKTIAITSDTMTLAGTGSTGTRTLADDGIATALKIASTSWLISGVGLT